MKVLSLLEPWASLINEKVKYIETRSWKTNYRGELYIHASSKKLNNKQLIEYKDKLDILNNINFNYGHIICKCNLIDCVYMTEEFIEKVKENREEYISGGYEVGRYAWILEDIQTLENPIKTKGKLGIWNYYE